MRIPNSQGSQLLTRGVWLAPWLGPSGELVLLAINRERKLAADPVVIPSGADQIEVATRLWEKLDQVDPISKEELATLRRERLKAV